LKRLTIAALSIALITAACGDSADAPDTELPATSVPEQTSTTTPPDDTTPEPAPVDEEPPTEERDPGELLPGVPSAVAATDLADRLGVAVSDLAVSVVESVVWPNGAIGCPEPGMSYTQALVPGVRVVIEYDGSSYYYHGTAADSLFFCENPTEPVSGDPGDA